MNLTIDIGNTRTKLGVFRGDQIVEQEVWENADAVKLEKWLYNQRIEKVILSSVAKPNRALTDFLKGRFFFVELTDRTPLPIAIDYETPHTLGKDRIAAVAGAYALFPGQNCLVIDAGTCITLDLLASEGVFLGGNISPGIQMRLQAMHHFTARLPLVGRKDQPEWVGKSTETAIRNGAQLGATLEVEGFIERCREQWPDLRVIVTGGDSDFFVRTLKTKIFANPNLVLVGLNKILEHNVQLLE